MKKSTMKKPNKVRAEKKAVRKPRLTKEEREARKLKLQEERAAKKAARLAKREAKKQKEAEKKAAAKAKREERKAKKLARLQKQKEREAARKLKAKERKAKKLIEKKPRAAKAEVKLSAKEKIEAERNEWKALSAIRRYVKDNAKILASLPEDKRIKRINKLQKMGYSIGLNPDGILSDIGYSFCAEIKIRGAKPAVPEKKERKPRAETTTEEVQQPQDSEVAEKAPEAEEEPLLTDEEILEAAKNDKAENVEVLAGDTFADETEIAANADELVDPGDADDVEEDEDDPDDDDDDDDDDPLSEGSDISREQEEYRQEAFKEMEANGTWD